MVRSHWKDFYHHISDGHSIIRVLLEAWKVKRTSKSLQQGFIFFQNFLCNLPNRRLKLTRITKTHYNIRFFFRLLFCFFNFVYLDVVGIGNCRMNRILFFWGIYLKARRFNKITLFRFLQNDILLKNLSCDIGRRRMTFFRIGSTIGFLFEEGISVANGRSYLVEVVIFNLIEFFWMLKLFHDNELLIRPILKGRPFLHMACLDISKRGSVHFIDGHRAMNGVLMAVNITSWR